LSNYPTLAVFGASHTRFGALPLPFDLTSFGAPGNHLYVSIEAAFPIVLSGGNNYYAGAVDVTIPLDPRLGGQTFYFQLVSVDSNANALGLVWSAGLYATIAPHIPFEAVYSQDPKATRGAYYEASNLGNRGGLVVRLGGSLFR